MKDQQKEFNEKQFDFSWQELAVQAFPEYDGESTAPRLPIAGAAACNTINLSSAENVTCQLVGTFNCVVCTGWLTNIPKSILCHQHCLPNQPTKCPPGSVTKDVCRVNTTCNRNTMCMQTQNCNHCTQTPTQCFASATCAAPTNGCGCTDLQGTKICQGTYQCGNQWTVYKNPKPAPSPASPKESVETAVFSALQARMQARLDESVLG